MNLCNNNLGGLNNLWNSYNGLLRVWYESATINNIHGNWIKLRISAPGFIDTYYHEFALGMNMLPDNDRPYFYIRRCDNYIPRGWVAIVG